MLTVEDNRPTDAEQEITNHDEASPEIEAVEQVETVSSDAPKSTVQDTWWVRIRRFFFQTASERRTEQRMRLHDLNRAIDRFPEVAVNYVLRAELHTEMKQYDLAKDDFERALELAPTQLDADRWGIIAQASQDRALRGLAQLRDRNLI
ncbi:MAG: tetratricopeptide repeat protein [Chloroflexota bacterium]